MHAHGGAFGMYMGDPSSSAWEILWQTQGGTLFKEHGGPFPTALSGVNEDKVAFVQIGSDSAWRFDHLNRPKGLFFITKFQLSTTSNDNSPLSPTFSSNGNVNIPLVTRQFLTP